MVSRACVVGEEECWAAPLNGVELNQARGREVVDHSGAVPRRNRYKGGGEHRADRPGARGLAAVVTFNPLCAEYPPRDWARRRATLILRAWVWLAGFGLSWHPATDAASEPPVATLQSLLPGAPGVLPTRLRANTGLPMLKIHSPQTSPALRKDVEQAKCG